VLGSLTLSSSTLVAETGHQGGEEVRDGSDRVEYLFGSAWTNLSGRPAYIVGKHEGPGFGVLESLDKGSLVGHVYLVLLSDLQSDDGEVLLPLVQPLGGSRVV